MEMAHKSANNITAETQLSQTATSRADGKILWPLSCVVIKLFLIFKINTFGIYQQAVKLDILKEKGLVLTRNRYVFYGLFKSLMILKQMIKVKFDHI